MLALGRVQGQAFGAPGRRVPGAPRSPGTGGGGGVPEALLEPGVGAGLTGSPW